MSNTKKPKAANDSTLSTSFVDTAWESLWGLADDTRAELHKQVGAIITLVEGVAQGATSYAASLNDRTDHVAREGLLAANRVGRTLAIGGRDASRKLLSSYRDGAAQLVMTTRDSARHVAERASATARVMVAPTKQNKAA